MTSKDLDKFSMELNKLYIALNHAKRVLLTAPAVADGDSIGSQLALRRMILEKFPSMEVAIVNDEPVAPRYLFLPDSSEAHTPETFPVLDRRFDVAIVVDGGIDRAGRVREPFEKAKTRVFIDHHAVSAPFPYDVRLVEPTASATTELIWYLSQMPFCQTEVTSEFAQFIYLGLIFDTGFFRHVNTTPEVMELAARLIRTGFDFRRVGEQGFLARSLASQRLLSDTLRRAQLLCDGKIIWAAHFREILRAFKGIPDDREVIIDQLFLTEGIEVAALFLDLGHGQTKVSFRSQGLIDVAQFARSVSQNAGGHRTMAGANFDLPVDHAIELVLPRLERAVEKALSPGKVVAH